MKFSERKGYTVVPNVIQTNGITDELRNSLWNILLIYWGIGQDNVWNRAISDHIFEFSAALWMAHFKKPVDERPPNAPVILQAIREHYFACEWYEVYDFLEFALNYYKSEKLNAIVNDVLERELSGYRFVSGIFTDITSSLEVAMLQSALSDKDFPAVKAHLQRSLELLSNREHPDYRNSIKESISAVESLAKTLSGNSKATLGDALKMIERKGGIHQALKEAFLKLYGYASDEGGIRHAMLEEPNLSAADAKFFLLSCTSFINYLKAKA
jgi:hypothetical protein